MDGSQKFYAASQPWSVVLAFLLNDRLAGHNIISNLENDTTSSVTWTDNFLTNVTKNTMKISF